jgi:hypothetical protein
VAEIGVSTPNIIARSPLVTPGPSSCELWRVLMYRAGENPDTSQWGPAALHYLNRAYWALCRGGGEWEEGLHEDWPWLRKVPPGVLVLEPEHSTAANGSTAQVVRGSSTIGVSIAPSVSCIGWQFRVTSAPSSDIFRVISHAPDQGSLILDAPYTGPTATAASYWLRQFDYPLATDLLHLIEPLHTDRVDAGSTGEIRLTSDATLAEQWCRWDGASGVPSQCALVGVHSTPPADIPTLQSTAFGQTILRFNRCANVQTGPIRVEYAYTFLPPVLTQTTGVCDEVPLCPPTMRWTLVDLALYLFALDRNDTRADGYVIFGKNGLRAAQRESRHQMAVTGQGIGRIYTRGRRGGWRGRAPLVIAPSGAAGPVGPAGVAGPMGPAGPPGEAEGWYSGAGAPAPGLGAVGDWYLDETTGDVYEKTGAGFALRGRR